MVDVVRKRASKVEDRLEEILIQQKLQHGKREGHTMESNGRGKCVQLNQKSRTKASHVLMIIPGQPGVGPTGARRAGSPARTSARQVGKLPTEDQVVRGRRQGRTCPLFRDSEVGTEGKPGKETRAECKISMWRGSTTPRVDPEGGQWNEQASAVSTRRQNGVS